MQQWVALLRGVNVNGVTVRSADLRDLFVHLDFTNVTTVLATGNVVFSDRVERQEAELKQLIETGLRDTFGYDAWILLATPARLEASIDAFPFDATDGNRQPYVVFCLDEPTQHALLTEPPTAVDQLAAGDGVVYWSPPVGRSTDTPFAKVLARRTYKERTTTRNLRTLHKIAAVLRSDTST